MIRLLFFGSEEEPTLIFRTLLKSKRIKIIGLVTSFNARQSTNVLDVYNVAQKEGLQVFTPEDVNNEAQNILKVTQPDIILVCNYGQFLNREILEYPKFKCLNIHFSLLPELRGACPVEMAILNGLDRTGITIQIMEEKMDTGDILFQKSINIEKYETGGSLMVKLQELSAVNIENVLLRYVEGEIKLYRQKEIKATYCFRKDISKEKARINWNNKSEYIERLIRAFNPKLIAWTYIKVDNKLMRFRIYKAKTDSNIDDFKEGEMNIIDDKLYIQTKEGSILPEVVQLEGKNKLTIGEFLRGYKDKISLR